MATPSDVKKLAEGVWAVEGESKLMPGFFLPLRCTIVRGTDGGLLLYSPIPLSEDAVEEIRKLGEVRTLFAPSLFHNGFVEGVKKAFPDAEVVGPTGLGERKKKLEVAREVDPSDVHPFGPDLEAVFVEGAPRFNEVLLHHRPSGMLLVADYFFNMHEARGMFTSFILKNVSKAFGAPKMSRLWSKAMKDREGMKRTAQRLVGLDTPSISVCHGDIIEGGNEVIQREVAWLLSD